MSLTKKISWRIEYLLYVPIEFCLGILPIALTARLARTLGSLAYHLSGRYRRIVQKNLRIVFAGEKSPEAIKQMSKEVFRRTAANLLCSARTSRMTLDQLDKTVEIQGYDIFRNELRKGKGIVVVLSHMGNWEALAQKFPHLTEPYAHHSGTVYRPLNNPLLNQRIEKTRQNKGLHIFSRKSTPLAMTRFVKNGNALGVLCDQRAGNAGEILPFFNHLVSCTPLPSILARHGASVIGLSIRTTHPGHWLIKVHLLEDAPTTANCMKLLEKIIMESPEDVFWFQDRWRLEQAHPLQLNGKGVSNTPVPQGVIPRRCLVWLEKIPEQMPLLPRGIPNDLSWEYAIPEGESLIPEWLNAQKLHRYQTSTSSRRLRKVILAIDSKDAFPLEIIYAPAPSSSALKKACKREKIPLIDG